MLNTIKLEIKQILKRKGKTMKDLCYQIKMTENGLIYAFKNNSLKVSTLQRIAEVLDVPLHNIISPGKAYVLDTKELQKSEEEAEKYLSQISQLQSEVDHLKERMKDKEQIIDILKKQ